MVTVLDGHPHAMSFLATVTGAPSTNLGVTGCGQSGDLQDRYHHHGIDTTSIMIAALDLLEQYSGTFHG